MNLKLNSKLIIFFVLLQPILDLITSFFIRYTDLSLTIGLIVRSIFMVYLTIYVLSIKRTSTKFSRYSKFILMSTIIYIGIFLLINMSLKDKYLIIGEIKGIIKTFYFPIVLCGIFISNEEDELNISNDLLIKVLFIYTLIIFIATMTNTYFNSYNKNGFGSVGWFYAANEIGAIISILLPFTMISIIKNTFNLYSIVPIITCILSVLFIGTKVPFISLVGFNIFISIYYLIYYKFSKDKLRERYKKIVIIYTSIITAIVLVFPILPLYKNIGKNYGSMIERMVNWNSKSNTEMKYSTENKVSKDEFVSAILSKRTVYVDIIKNRYNISGIYSKLFGLGYSIKVDESIYDSKFIDDDKLNLLLGIKSRIQKNEEIYTSKTIELDQFDIFYRHGYIGTIIYFSQFIMILIYIIRNLYVNKKNILNINIITCIISILLSLSIAFTAGHILTAPGVAIFLIIIIIKLYNLVKVEREKYNWRRLPY